MACALASASRAALAVLLLCMLLQVVPVAQHGFDAHAESAGSAHLCLQVIDGCHLRAHVPRRHVAG
jgi:NAD-dependent SIR2 family protein deacetylase